MHNRKKQERPPTDAEVAALKKKSTTYASLVNILFDRRSKHDHSNETLDLIGKMLRNNPDFYSLWNFRREVLFSLHPGLQSAGGASGEKFRDESAAAICEAEMSLSADGIRRNPKSYGAWHHREWIIHRFDVNYSQELELCKEFLRQDQRNFHCWNYRRFVATVAGISPEAELQFSAEKIQENFSNYSAFHHRSIYIKQVSVSSCGMGVGGGINNDTVVPAAADRPGSARTRQPLQEIIPGELKIIENAIFTEPDDQSAWWYHQFLMTWIRSEISASVSDAAAAAAAAVVDAASSATITTAPSPSFATANQQQVQQRELVQWFMGVLEQQRELVGSLMEVEDSCRWVLGCMLSMTDTLLWLMGMPGVVSSATTTATTSTTSTTSSNGGGFSVGVEALVAERLLLLDKLLQIDPLHVNRYRYLLQQHQLTSSYY